MSDELVSSSSSYSSSRCASSSSSCSVLSKTPRRRSMEEVWKEISLSSALQQAETPSTPSLSLHQQQHHHHHGGWTRIAAAAASDAASIPPTATSSLRGITLQDFLSGPLKQPYTPLIPQEPQPPTALSLHCGQLLGCISPNSNGSSSDLSSSEVPVNVNASSLYLSKKLSPEMLANQSPDDGVDHKKKRLIKNRESAARSRARKQAYTRELELEVAQLTSENRRIKRQHEELLMKMAALAPVSAKPKLHRTLTSPF